MAIPATKTEFGDWCKRKLGYPVIDINVDTDQVDDRVDEAIQYYQMLSLIHISEPTRQERMGFCGVWF